MNNIKVKIFECENCGNGQYFIERSTNVIVELTPVNNEGTKVAVSQREVMEDWPWRFSSYYCGQCDSEVKNEWTDELGGKI
jgi:hypothetical protein